jgi:hypothetical protein
MTIKFERHKSWIFGEEDISYEFYNTDWGRKKRILYISKHGFEQMFYDMAEELGCTRIKIKDKIE